MTHICAEPAPPSPLPSRLRSSCTSGTSLKNPKNLRTLSPLFLNQCHKKQCLAGFLIPNETSRDRSEFRLPLRSLDGAASTKRERRVLGKGGGRGKEGVGTAGPSGPGGEWRRSKEQRLAQAAGQAWIEAGLQLQQRARVTNRPRTGRRRNQEGNPHGIYRRRRRGCDRGTAPPPGSRRRPARAVLVSLGGIPVRVAAEWHSVAARSSSGSSTEPRRSSLLSNGVAAAVRAPMVAARGRCSVNGGCPPCVTA